jgi:hypothetical protein
VLGNEVMKYYPCLFIAFSQESILTASHLLSPPEGEEVRDKDTSPSIWEHVLAQELYQHILWVEKRR